MEYYTQFGSGIRGNEGFGVVGRDEVRNPTWVSLLPHRSRMEFTCLHGNHEIEISKPSMVFLGSVCRDDPAGSGTPGTA
jgi:hypothetical protein